MINSASSEIEQSPSQMNSSNVLYTPKAIKILRVCHISLKITFIFNKVGVQIH